MDERLRTLEKEVHRAPGDEEARAALRAALRRVADLGCRARWNQADAASQDVVIGVMARLLGETFVVSRAGTRHAAGGAWHRIATLRHARTGLELQLLPGGTFGMGGSEDESGRHPVRLNEQPRHEVHVPPFLLGRFPVRQCEWDLVGGIDARSWEGPRLPIEGVSWDAAEAWLASASGGLRLPSEAEWEYACRAGTQGAYYWGEDPDPRFCWFGAGPEEWRTHAPEAHEHAPNAFGLVDMSGNVAEWCQDHYVSTYRGAPCDGSARSTPRSDLRVIRGGDSFNTASHCRSAARNLSSRHARGAGIGFRAARDLPW
ncbi:MAG: formylglycine-generating enzyme family protein [Planctomycetota bacterium]